MSYNVQLLENINGEPVKVDRHSEGGTCVAFVYNEETRTCLKGTDEAELNITYNYSPIYRKHFHESGIQYLNGKKAKEVIKLLEETIRELGIEQSSDYWKPTKGNAGYALRILLEWGRQYPEAIFVVH